MAPTVRSITAGSKAAQEATRASRSASAQSIYAGRPSTGKVWDAGTATTHGPQRPTYHGHPDQKVTSPGDASHHPMTPKALKDNWDTVSTSMNNRIENRRRYGKHGRLLVGAGAGGFGITAGTIPITNAINNRKYKKLTTRKPVAKGLKMPKNPFRIAPRAKSWERDNVGLRVAGRQHGAYNVSTMDEPINLADHAKKPPMERLGQRFANSPGALESSAYIGLGAGAVAAVPATHKSKTRLEAAQRAKNNRRKVITKSVLNDPALIRAHFGSPRRIARTLKSNPQLVAFGGAGVASGAAQHPAITRHMDTKEKHRSDLGTAGVTGAIGGQSAYQLATYGSNAYANANHDALTYKDPVKRRGYKDPKQKKILEAHKAKYGLNNPKVTSDYKGFYRNMPDSVHSGKHLRINAHLTTGKRGVAIGTAATAVGALTSMGAVGKKPVAKAFPKLQAHARKKATKYLTSLIEPIDKPIVHHTMRAAVLGGVGGGAMGGAAGAAVIGHRQKVEKGLYSRESRPSVLRATEFGVGAGIAAWGLGRSPMLGAALGRGVKMATARGNNQALQALRMAQATQGILRRGTAPGERAVRQVRALNQAIERVPRAIRPEVASAAGILLVANAHPVNRTSYRPVSTNVQFRRVF